MAVNVVYTRVVNVDDNGNVVDKSNTSETILEMQTTSSEMRIVENPNVPNSMGWPTIEDYLTAEDSAGMKIAHMSSTMIVTQD